MSATPMSVGLEKARVRWGWFLALGIMMVVLGFVALGDSVMVTVVSVILLGWLLILSGIFHAIKLVRSRAHVFLDVLGLVFDIVLGVILLANPAVGAVSLTKKSRSSWGRWRANKRLECLSSGRMWRFGTGRI
jgi:uncharacterized membrane protein HdeD (DUF308 family)